MHNGTNYWSTYQLARNWAENNPPWDPERVIEFGRGWAVQSSKSGNYAGPGVEPRQWRGYATFLTREEAEKKDR